MTDHDHGIADAAPHPFSLLDAIHGDKADEVRRHLAIERREREYQEQARHEHDARREHRERADNDLDSFLDTLRQASDRKRLALARELRPLLLAVHEEGKAVRRG
ncbi:MAG: hypothetical protein K2W96_06945 [Gemmataceae bacterium]|nr:hypothetical protein [Gemmataceae bacterium]